MDVRGRVRRLALDLRDQRRRLGDATRRGQTHRAQEPQPRPERRRRLHAAVHRETLVESPQALLTPPQQRVGDAGQTRPQRAPDREITVRDDVQELRRPGGDQLRLGTPQPQEPRVVQRVHE